MADFNGLPMSGPGEQGFDAAHLGKIDTTMAAAVERRHVPGVVTVVARHGKVVHAGAVGSLDLDVQDNELGCLLYTSPSPRDRG